MWPQAPLYGLLFPQLSVVWLHLPCHLPGLRFLPGLGLLRSVSLCINWTRFPHWASTSIFDLFSHLAFAYHAWPLPPLPGVSSSLRFHLTSVGLSRTCILHLASAATCLASATFIWPLHVVYFLSCMTCSLPTWPLPQLASIPYSIYDFACLPLYHFHRLSHQA